VTGGGGAVAGGGGGAVVVVVVGGAVVVVGGWVVVGAAVVVVVRRIVVDGCSVVSEVLAVSVVSGSASAATRATTQTNTVPTSAPMRAGNGHDLNHAHGLACDGAGRAPARVGPCIPPLATGCGGQSCIS
jgi:hypothetical protein